MRPKLAPTPAPRVRPGPPRPGAKARTFAITRGKVAGRGQRILLYGDSGAGKSTLASLLPRALFVDLEQGSLELDAPRVLLDSYADARALLGGSQADEFGALVIDTFTALQRLATDHVLATMGGKSIEDFGYGKGYRFIFESMALVLADLDRHAEQGRHVCVVCHAEATQAPNPKGADWLRWEPQLQARRDCNVRTTVLQWADHVLFLGKDVIVEKDGRGRGGKTRTLHVTEDATQLAKSRRLRDSLAVIEGDAKVWRGIIA